MASGSSSKLCQVSAWHGLWCLQIDVQSGLTSTILPSSLAGLQREFAVPMVVSPHAEMYGMSTQVFSRINSSAVLLCFALQSARALGSGQCSSGGLGFLVLMCLSALTPLLFFDADTFFKFFNEKRII